MSSGAQNGRSESGGHLNQELIEKYQSRNLALEELQAADRHLSGCGICRRALLARMGLVRLPEELAEIQEPLHLSYEQITAYIDRELSRADTERVEAHTFICASCSREVADLKRLDAQLTASEPVAAKVEAKPSLGRRIANFFAVPGRARELGLAVGAIVVGLFLFRAGKGSVSGSPTATQIFLPGAHASASHLGGYALLAAGMVYLVYVLFRKR
jgi:hypothetical protein